jgi:hypothetical protein
MKKTMFPRNFIIWKDEYASVILIKNGKYGHWYIYDGEFYSLDKLYKYWRLEIEPKNKENENR